MVKTEWRDDGRPEFVPVWIPSIDAIKESSLSVVDNVKDNLMAPKKDKKEAAIEVALVLTVAVGFLMTLIGIGPGIPPWFIPQIVGLALVVVGIFYTCTSMATLAAESTVLPTASNITIVKEGVFAHCRHPGYFGMISFGLGFSLVTLSSSRLIWVALMWLALDKLADIEELFLGEYYPGYKEYAAELPKFIPGRLVTGRPDPTFERLPNEPGSPSVVVDKIAE